jgi:diguanylate cyclase (GGDEF)-like protein
MPETRLADGLIVAERIRESVEAGVGAARPVTVSIGVVAMALGVDKPEDLISQADQALYQSKSSGRNIVSFYDHGAGEAFNLAPAA